MKPTLTVLLLVASIIVGWHLRLVMGRGVVLTNVTHRGHLHGDHLWGRAHWGHEAEAGVMLASGEWGWRLLWDRDDGGCLCVRVRLPTGLEIHSDYVTTWKYANLEKCSDTENYSMTNKKIFTQHEKIFDNSGMFNSAARKIAWGIKRSNTWSIWTRPVYCRE